jgi:Xaa-Pro aminopeptidase
MTFFEQHLQKLGSHQAILLTSPISRRYVTNFQSSDGAVFAYQNKILLFLDMRYYEMAQIAKAKGKLVESVEVKHLKDFNSAVSELIKSGIKEIFFEEKRTYCAQLDRFKKNFPDASFFPFGDTLEVIRSRKTPEELEKKFFDGGIWMNRDADFNASPAGFYRINIASPREVIREAIERMKDILTK